jgi:topoisomerase-4 subunit B
VLPLRGKILNVANASSQKMSQNQLLSDLIRRWGVGTGSKYRDEDLRYERVIVMTDADVGRRPHRLAADHVLLPGDAGADRERAPLPGDAAALQAHARRQVGLRARRQAQGRADQARVRRQRQGGDQPLQGPGRDERPQLKKTTMDTAKRTLLQVEIAGDKAQITEAVNALMGSKPEARFRFIQERARLRQGPGI